MHLALVEGKWPNYCKTFDGLPELVATAVFFPGATDFLRFFLHSRLTL